LQGIELKVEVAAEYFWHVFTDSQFAEVRQIVTA